MYIYIYTHTHNDILYYTIKHYNDVLHILYIHTYI